MATKEPPMATKAAQCGMIPVVLDMDTAQFPATEQALKAAGALEVFTARADVSKAAELAQVAKDVYFDDFKRLYENIRARLSEMVKSDYTLRMLDSASHVRSKAALRRQAVQKGSPPQVSGTRAATT